MTARSVKLSCYLDCVSPYSWFTFIRIKRSRALLNEHGVQVNIVPFFLGGARDGNGNPFQDKPAVVQAWGQHDLQRTARLLGIKVVQPEKFPILSLFPMRVVTYIQGAFDQERFERSLEALWDAFYGGRGIDTSTPSGVVESLKSIFSKEELERILAGAVAPENKKKLLENTKAAQDAGCFGAPWIVATNRKGETESFWGNDRWDHIYAHLELPFSPATLLPASKL